MVYFFIFTIFPLCTTYLVTSRYMLVSFSRLLLILGVLWPVGEPPLPSLPPLPKLTMLWLFVRRPARGEAMSTRSAPEDWEVFL